MVDFYQVLDVAKDASPEVIKQNYRRKSKEFHPDRNSSSWARQQFETVQEAYQTLIEPDSRRQYDQSLNSFYGIPERSPRSSNFIDQAMSMGMKLAEGWARNLADEVVTDYGIPLGPFGLGEFVEDLNIGMFQDVDGIHFGVSFDEQDSREMLRLSQQIPVEKIAKKLGQEIAKEIESYFLQQWSR